MIAARNQATLAHPLSARTLAVLVFVSTSLLTSLYFYCPLPKQNDTTLMHTQASSVAIDDLEHSQQLQKIM